MQRITRRALAGAGLLSGVFALCCYAVFHVGYVQHVDASIFEGFSSLRGRPHVSGVAGVIANLCDPSPYVYLCALPVGIALARRRPLSAVAILAILLGANLTTELLKPLLAAPRPGGLPSHTVAQASFPSGHATASMALALCTVLACPPRWRPWGAALGSAFAVAVSYSFLTLGWHYPSDALGGLLIASVWTLLGIAALAEVQARRGRQGTGRLWGGRSALSAATPSAAVAGLTVLGAAAVALIRPYAALSYLRLHTSFVIGAAALGALALVLAAGVAATLRPLQSR